MEHQDGDRPGGKPGHHPSRHAGACVSHTPASPRLLGDQYGTRGAGRRKKKAPRRYPAAGTPAGAPRGPALPWRARRNPTTDRLARLNTTPTPNAGA